jgi:signal transduction histidine kinase
VGGLLDAAAVWPLALTLATVGVVDRVRTARRRQGLNRALHELRRPLQALLLNRAQLNGAAGQVEMALAALTQLDAEINGVAGASRPGRTRVAGLVAGAVERWRGAATIAGRSLEVAGCVPAWDVVGRPERIAQALDNLIANALEHGNGAIRIGVAGYGGTVRITVADGGGDDPTAGPTEIAWRGPRRGHGLRIAAAVAAEHGGRVEVSRSTAGTVVALELPVGPRAHG